GKGVRCLCGGVGIGFGAGLGWAQGDMHLRHPNLVPMPSLDNELRRLQTLKASVAERLGIRL
ncbi:unnamed protein product, partial [Symbiodinium pilosum]